MFLRAKVRKKDGKEHPYFSVVENRRMGQKRKRVAGNSGTKKSRLLKIGNHSSLAAQPGGGGR